MDSFDHEFRLALEDDADFLERVKFYISQVAVFSTLEVEDIDELLRIAHAVIYGPREVIFEQESRGEDIHIVLSGKCLLLRKNKDGSSNLMGQRGMGESFGEIGFLTTSPRTLTVVNDNEESLQLRISRETFMQLCARRPRIGAAVYTEILNSIHQRLDNLPTYYKNFVMWGYRTQREDLATEPGGPGAFSKSKVFLAFGLLTGVVQTFLLGLLVQRYGEAIYPAFQGLQLPIGVLLTVASSIFGVFIGEYYDRIEKEVKMRQEHPRCCARCKFVVFDDATGKHDCLFHQEQELKIFYRLGIAHDTYTDCPSFEATEGAVVKARKRDMMGKD